MPCSSISTRQHAIFLSFYPPDQRADDSGATLLIVFGSERSFCGGFNKLVAQAMLKYRDTDPRQRIIAVGSRLQHTEEYLLLEEQQSDRHTIVTGALVAEEIPSVLNTLVECIANWQSDKKNCFSCITALYHNSHTAKVEQKNIFPLSLDIPKEIDILRYAPQIYLPPDTLYRQLLENYMFVTLESVITDSLMAENQARIQHMEGAEHHANDELEQLARRHQQIRQEEITEEIELITLFTQHNFI